MTKVITELAYRQQEVGPQTTTDGDTDSRRIVNESLTDWQGQPARTQYA